MVGELRGGEDSDNNSAKQDIRIQYNRYLQEVHR